MSPKHRQPPPGGDSVEAALGRAARHGRRAAAEALLAARALLDALSLTLHGARADERRILGLAARTLDDLADGLAGGATRPGLLAAVAEALDVEIARWEARAGHDDHARAVLRAYLGLREILWELGVRRSERAGSRPGGGEPGSSKLGSSEPGVSDLGGGPRPAGGRGPQRRGRRRGDRVQRVPVEG